MTKDTIEDILKGAILLEHKGKALYDSVLKTSQVKGVREIFKMLAQEEVKHIQILTDQYSLMKKGEEFDLSGLDDVAFSASDEIITEDLVKEVFGAGYEAAVISAALSFEKNAVQFYSQQAVNAGGGKEREFFQWLTKWEKTHLYMLAKLDNEIKEQIWYDNQFWPLD
ncbi:ferritin family protein [Acidobacteriota bacterium]